MQGSILIVDDEQAIRDSLLLVLEEEGYRCTAVENGHEALQLARQDTFDLLITDLIMPRMKGNELIKNISRLSPDMPIIILTSYSNAHIASNIRDCCNTTNLFKPIDFDELIHQIRNLIGQPSN